MRFCANKTGLTLSLPQAIILGFCKQHRSNKTSHLDLRCLTFTLSTLHINVFPNDSLLKIKKADDKCRLNFGAERVKLSNSVSTDRSTAVPLLPLCFCVGGLILSSPSFGASGRLRFVIVAWTLGIFAYISEPIHSFPIELDIAQILRRQDITPFSSKLYSIAKYSTVRQSTTQERTVQHSIV